jgi:large subunit ribosomal protein L15
VIDNAALAEAGLVPSAFTSVKLILNGDIKTKKTVKLQAASAGAIKALERAGGRFEVSQRAPRPAKKPAEKS